MLSCSPLATFRFLLFWNDSLTKSSCSKLQKAKQSVSDAARSPDIIMCQNKTKNQMFCSFTRYNVILAYCFFFTSFRIFKWFHATTNVALLHQGYNNSSFPSIHFSIFPCFVVFSQPPKFLFSLLFSPVCSNPFFIPYVKFLSHFSNQRIWNEIFTVVWF